MDKQIRGVLFDLDNTLYSYREPSEAGISGAYRKFIDLKGAGRASRKVFEDAYLASRAEIHKELSGTASSHNRILYFQRLLEKLGSRASPREILALNSEYWRAFLSKMRLVGGARELLSKLRTKGLKIGILTDLTTEIQLRKLEKLGISQYVDFVVTSEEAGNDKPHSVMFFLALRKMGLPPEKVAIVGDNPVADIEGAKYVGMVTILLGERRRRRARNKFDNTIPDFFAGNLREAGELLERLSESAGEGYSKFSCSRSPGEGATPEEAREIGRARSELVRAGLLGIHPDGVGFGNISKRRGGSKEPVFAITGSRTGGLVRLSRKNYSIVTSFDIGKNHLSCTGSSDASSESLTHAECYRRAKWVGAILHVHSDSDWRRLSGKIPSTPKNAEYGTPEIARSAGELASGGARAIRMGGHIGGLLFLGETLESALEKAKEILPNRF